MARGGRGDITGNVPGQGFTSPSPCTHVQGAYGAPTGAVGGAADGRRARTNAPAVRQRLGVVSTDCMAALSTCLRTAGINMRKRRLSTICLLYERTTRAASLPLSFPADHAHAHQQRWGYAWEGVA